MSREVDGRGLSCPQPVLLAKRAILEGDFPIHVFVDTATSSENMRRLAEKTGLGVKVLEEGNTYKLVIEK